MNKEKTQIRSNNIYTVFAFRYIFDERNDVVDLRSDVRDLHQFPERLMGSYEAEWQKYIRKATSKLSIDLTEEHATTLVDSLPRFQQKELSEFLGIIDKTIIINTSPNIKVIKTGLKSYIEALLKV
jgi:hypothetical protein